MLHIHCEERLAKTREFAKAMGGKWEKSLQSKLDYLATYAGGKDNGVECHLFDDWAQHSFSFQMSKEGKIWFCGGLIYHGPTETPEDNLTVSLAKLNGNEVLWSVHT